MSDEPRWLVITPDPLSDAMARSCVALTFGLIPSDDVIEVCTPPFPIDRTYVVDRSKVGDLSDAEIVARGFFREAKP